MLLVTSGKTRYKQDVPQGGSMNRYLILVALLAMLTACASQSTTYAENPDTVCLDKGLTTGTDEYNNCIATQINAQCVGQGFEQNTDAHKKCQKELREAVFTRQQLRMRGY